MASRFPPGILGFCGLAASGTTPPHTHPDSYLPYSPITAASLLFCRHITPAMVPPQGLCSCVPSASLVKMSPSQRGLPHPLDLKTQHLAQHSPTALLSLPPPHTLQVLPVCLPLCHHVTSMKAGTIVCVFTVVSPVPRTESSTNQMLKYLLNK